MRSAPWSPVGQRPATAGCDGLIQINAIDQQGLMGLTRQRVAADLRGGLQEVPADGRNARQSLTSTKALVLDLHAGSSRLV
jgi:hypothetical protein